MTQLTTQNAKWSTEQTREILC